MERLRADGDLVPPLCLVALGRPDGRGSSRGPDGYPVVGHVACSRGTVEGRPVIGLGPLGVLPEHQRGGIGRALMHAVLAAADALEEPAVLLLGSPAYYGQFGFEVAEHVGIVAPEPDWGQHFQVRRLTAWDGTLRGRFRYAQAFTDL